MFRVYVGKRESDILTCQYFNFSITYYGSNTNNNRSFSTVMRDESNYLNDYTNFVVEMLNTIVKDHINVEIHFYNYVFAHNICKICPNLKQYIVNMNSQYILNFLRHKTLSRIWLSNSVITPAYTALSKSECSFLNLVNKFGEYHGFVLQKNFSGGGLGTYILTKANEDEMLIELSNEQFYLVSPYYANCKNYSSYIIVDNNTFAITAISEQILDTGRSHIEYRGNCYLGSDHPEYHKLYKESCKIANRLKDIGYKGICGLDFIDCSGTLMLIELNPRYLGSSYAVNYALQQSSLPSLFEISSLCFDNKLNQQLVEKLNTLSIRLKNECYFFNNNLSQICELKNKSKVILFEDGYSAAEVFENNVYLARTIELL